MNKFTERPPDYAKVSYVHDYEDGGISVGTTAAAAPRIFDVEYTLDPPDAKIISNHHDDAFGMAYPFLFIHRDTGEVLEGVRYLAYDQTHDVDWIQFIKLTLIWTP